jgi:hypothetical protein
LASGRISGSYTGITAVGTLTSLTVDPPNSLPITINDWANNNAYVSLGSTYGYLLFGPAGDPNVYVRASSGTVYIGTTASNSLSVSTTAISANVAFNTQLQTNSNFYTTGGNLVVTNPATGSGNAAQWTYAFGAYTLVRNTSTRNGG